MLQRFARNPILIPSQVKPSRPDMEVALVLNPGAFEYQGRIGLLLRIAERPIPEDGWVCAPFFDPEAESGIRILKVRKDDPDLVGTDPRGFSYKGRGYITMLSHLRLAWSDDDINFTVDPEPTLLGQGAHESFGIEDCRVEFVNRRYWLTYSAVSEFGCGVGLISTADWKSFERHGLIFPPHNKDCALFPEQIGGNYWSLHRPSGVDLGGHYIWVAKSDGMFNWGGHHCIATTRPGKWDSQRIGAGAAPIRTERGWLSIYHGADENSRYCLGGLLLDLDDPRKVLARSETPLMEPDAEYEQKGFFGHVVFTNGHIVRGDEVTIYYGASDTVVCGVKASLSTMLSSL